MILSIMYYNMYLKNYVYVLKYVLKKLHSFYLPNKHNFVFTYPQKILFTYPL